MNNKFKYSLVFAAVTLTSVCSSLGVEPWERELLAKKEMENEIQLVRRKSDAEVRDFSRGSVKHPSTMRIFKNPPCRCKSFYNADF